MGERQWCLSCGTVTRDGTCDCTRTDRPELQNLVNYADELKRELTAANADRDRLENDLEMAADNMRAANEQSAHDLTEMEGELLAVRADRDRLARELERTKTNGLVLLGASGEAREAAEDTIARLARELEKAREALRGVRANLVRLAWEENSVMIEGIDAALASGEAP